MYLFVKKWGTNLIYINEGGIYRVADIPCPTDISQAGVSAQPGS
jgi:hypothetical protein